MITVILINHAAKRDISKTLESLYEQTYKDFELIIESGNGTLGENFNNGLKKAKGEWVKILADDDYLPPRSLELYSQNFKKGDWIMGDVVNYSDSDERKHELGLVSSVFYNTKCLIADNTIHGGASLYKTDILRQIGGMREDLITGEEYELNIRLSTVVSPVYFSGIVYNYQIHPGNKGVLHKDFATRDDRKQYIREQIQNEAFYFNKI